MEYCHLLFYIVTHKHRKMIKYIYMIEFLYQQDYEGIREDILLFSSRERALSYWLEIRGEVVPHFASYNTYKVTLYKVFIDEQNSLGEQLKEEIKTLFDNRTI